MNWSNTLVSCATAALLTGLPGLVWAQDAANGMDMNTPTEGARPEAEGPPSRGCPTSLRLFRSIVWSENRADVPQS